MSRDYDKSLADYFSIKKICKLKTQKDYKINFWHNIKAYIKSNNMCLVLKIIIYKLYNNLKLLFISINQ